MISECASAYAGQYITLVWTYFPSFIFNNKTIEIETMGTNDNANKQRKKPVKKLVIIYKKVNCRVSKSSILEITS